MAGFLDKMKSLSLAQKNYSEPKNAAAKTDTTTCPNCGAGRIKKDGLTRCAYCGYTFIKADLSDGIYIAKEDNSK
ncbi:MAG: hypothetical protein LBS73_02465 [Campylobacteraceae bacterium]|jgi:uncharacterized Zn finger protein (UPF0148 family)|nr:hypothetical protein [Campylobacteraceae bacterium]